MSPKHVLDSFKTTFKKRPAKKNIYLQCMLMVMLTYMMAYMAEKYCQFMYTKRLFQWEMDTYSYYDMIRTIICTIGTFVIMPVFHYFNINDNIIIIASFLSSMSSILLRAFAKTEQIFYASTLLGVFSTNQSAPIRAQISRCVSPEELGKVFAMLASTECLVPIIASSVFTSLYNQTSDLGYPGQATFYFVETAIMCIGWLGNIEQNNALISCCHNPGLALTFYVWISLGFKQIPPIREEIEDVTEEKGQAGKMKVIYESYSNNTGFYTTHI